MKLVVLGATGGTGREVVQQALDQGHHVVALVRTPGNLTMQHKNLKIVKGDILAQDTDLKKVFEGQDAVLSCLGRSTKSSSFSQSFFAKVTLYTDTMEIIVKAMRRAGVKRLICMTSWCTRYDSKDPGPWVIEWLVKPLLLGRILANMAVMEDFLNEKCSDIDFTVVRPPGLTKHPLKGKEVLVEERMFVDGAVAAMPRADVAKFMLNISSTGEYSGKAIAIALK